MTLAATLKANKNRTFPPHLIIIARAGTGKTTTLVEGLKLIKGGKPKITPSPQQKDVWNSMKLSKDAKTVGFVAFNKSIANELEERVPQGCDAMTMHSMGFRAVKKHFEEVLTGNRAMNKFRVDDIISSLLGKDIREIRRNEPDLIKGTKKLVSLCKMNLIGHRDIKDLSYDELSALVSHYGIELNGSCEKVFKLVPQVLERCKQVDRDGCIDYDDMIWLPIVLGLDVFCYDLLLVDEAQDLNRCQQALALEAGNRLILCGDPQQAIYGFAGADSESMKRMEDTLSDSKYGCDTLPLTVTRRCGKAIVAEANKIVPDFFSHEDNGKGRISKLPMKGADTYDEYKAASKKDKQQSYRSHVNSGDMLLCRVNAPLVSECFKFIKQGRKANIQGRDVGQGLISTINKMKAEDIGHLQMRLSDWVHREVQAENNKRNPSDTRIITLQDRYDCLCCFMEGKDTIDQVIKAIQDVFTDDRETVGIKLSSVHKAKGLEAKRVFLLEPEGASIPHPMAKTSWQREQELNLRYVAITRAIEELIYVS